MRRWFVLLILAVSACGGGSGGPDGGPADASERPDSRVPDARPPDAGPDAEVADANPGVPATSITTGNTFSCALLEDGAVRCWGFNLQGQLGQSNTENLGDDETPAEGGDAPLGASVVQISANGGHVCAVVDKGALRCWGNAEEGQLGYGNVDHVGDDEPPSIAGNVDVGAMVTQVAAGGHHTCALLTTGAIRCWGQGSFGALGYGNTDSIGDDETPVSGGDVLVGGTVTQVTAGTEHSCALLATGNVRCWGSGSFGRLGYGNVNAVGDDETAGTAGDVNVGATVEQIVAGGAHTCVILDGGAVRCWGRNTSGELGYASTLAVGDNETPASAGNVDVGGPVSQLALGMNHTCAVLEGGALRCWGRNLEGQLGYGNTSNLGDYEPPSSVGGVDVGGP